MSRPDFTPRMNSSVRAYLTACRRAENFGKREQRSRLRGTSLVIYGVLFVSCLVLFLVLD